MNYSYNWYSCSGSATDDNRDFCGIANCSHTGLFILADGSTSGRQGGRLAQDLVASLLEMCRNSPSPPSPESVTGWCRRTHEELRFRYPGASASYLIGIPGAGGEWTTLHAGDCILGTITNDGPIRWHLQPHTLANALCSVSHKELADNPARHCLTKNFRPSHFMAPECNTFTFPPEEKIIFASDGFWADLPEKMQGQLIKGQTISEINRDDISFLLLVKDTPGENVSITESTNIQII